MYSEFEAKIEYVFKNKELLIQALTHSSFSYENEKVKNNERLEFLGDAVLELCTSDFLYKKFNDFSEGQLTKLRASIVCEDNLAKISKQLQLGKYLRLGKGEENSNGRQRNSTLSDAFEAVIGAAYLDGGFDAAKALVHRLVTVDVNASQSIYFPNDYKTQLQEMVQQENGVPVSYKILEQFGPDHNKTFVAQVSQGNNILGKGKGKTKKEAEQQAAFEALEALDSKDSKL